MRLFGEQRAKLDFAIQAALAAYHLLVDQYPSQAVQRVNRFGKADTLALDAIPEITLYKRLTEFNDRIPLITEENGEGYLTADLHSETIIVADPTDRSQFFADFLANMAKRNDKKKIIEQLKSSVWLAEWESAAAGPVQVTGATIAISCIHNKLPLFAVILNYITRTLFIACPTGTYSLDISTMSESELMEVTSLTVSNTGKPIHFPSARDRGLRGDDLLRFVTFLKKSGYMENLNDSMVFLRDPTKLVVYDAPGGPSRILYLSSLNATKTKADLGFILANGEKITEWIHWLPFIRFAENEDGGPALKLFEVSIERPWTKEGILMSTSPTYSIFVERGGKDFEIDLGRLSHYSNPSQYRGMLVATSHDNERVANLMLQHGYREIFFR